MVLVIKLNEAVRMLMFEYMRQLKMGGYGIVMLLGKSQRVLKKATEWANNFCIEYGA